MTPADGRMLRRPRAGASGISHIEVLVAMLVIALATPMILGGIIGSLNRSRRSYDQGAATAWAQGEIDYLRRQCYDRLSPGTRKATAATLQPGEPSLPLGFAAAYIQVETAGTANLRATVALYRNDWRGEAPAGPPVLETTTYIGDFRVAGMCP